MKVGDNLYCYSSLISDVNGIIKVKIDFTVGKVYSVFNINNSFSAAAEDINDQEERDDNKYVWVKNDNGFFDWFSILDYHIWYIGINFYTENEMRKIKLNKLNKLNIVDTL